MIFNKTLFQKGRHFDFFITCFILSLWPYHSACYYIRSYIRE